MNQNLPNDGGSYSRDPVTGELTLLEPATATPPGKSASQAAAADAEADAEAVTPASIAGLSRRGQRRADSTTTTPE